MRSHFNHQLVSRGLMAAAAVFALAVSRAQAEDSFPTGSVKIIVPFAAGGTTDAAMRVLGDELGKHWGQPVIIDNKPGGDTVLAMVDAKKAPNDGHTLVITTSTSLTVNPLLYSRIPYNPQADFEAVTTLFEFPLSLVVSSNLGANSVGDFLKRAKDGDLSYASLGNGSLGHLVVEGLKGKSGIDVAHIPYDGVGPIALAMQSAEADFTLMSAASLQSVLDSGAAKALAIGSKERSPKYPDVPSMEEVGLEGLNAVDWMAILAPAGTDAATIQTIYDGIKVAAATPGFVNIMDKLDRNVVVQTPEATATRIVQELEHWRPLIAELGLKAD